MPFFQLKPFARRLACIPSLALSFCLFTASTHLYAQDPPQSPAPADTPDSVSPDDDSPTFMKYLANKGHHNITEERWNAYSQFTYIYSWKQAFDAAYTNANGSTNSLLPNAEQAFTGSATLYLGAKMWKGGEVYFVPELISERALSNLKGLGSAIQDFELQKGGAETPTLYVSRIYVKQSFNFGGKDVPQDSGPQQLGTTDKSRRLVISLGNFSILDFFDKNQFDIDPRQGLLSLAFMTYGAWDFASNARGYSWGGVGELYLDNWAVRYGRITPPKQPNQLPVDFRLTKYYGDQFELEHDHTLHGHDGKVRILGYRNHEVIGKFSDAIAAYEANPAENATTCTSFNYGNLNPTAPDLCWARKPNTKLGIGAFGEQYVTKDIGLFARGMYSDGKTEVDAFSSTDRSLSFGSLTKGGAWSRPHDLAGLAYNIGWISAIHAKYLGMGGIDGFVGDGYIKQAPEGDLDVFYSVNMHKSFWFTGDYQRVNNPAFNSDRGPVNIWGVRLHGQF